MGKTAKNKILKFWPLGAIFLLVITFAFPYWFKGLVPFPANHLVTAFAPWQYYYGMPVKNNAMPDVVTQMYPWKHLIINLWKEGIVPLWNPYNFSGNPFLGNYQSAVFHPFNFLFFVLPEIDAWSLLILFQPLLAGLFTYLFCRRLKLGQAASLISAISFMFCGFITVWMAYGTMAHALLWLPLVLYGIERSFAEFSPLSLILISFPLAASLFSGHFQISLYVILFSFSFLLFKLITTKKKKRFLVCFLFVFLGCSLAAIQLLPTVELHQFSVRSEAFGLSEIIPWSYLVTLIAPDFYGNSVTRNDWFGHYAEWRGFAGVIPLILAFYVVIRKKNRYVWFFVLMGTLSLFLAFSSPLQDLLVKLRLPVLSTSAAARIIGLFSFSGAILAGFGFDQLREDLNKKKLRAIIFACLIVLILIGLIWGVLLIKKPFRIDRILIAKRNLILPTGMVAALFSLILFYWFIEKVYEKKKLIIQRSRWLVLATLLFMVAFDLFHFAQKWMPFDSRNYVYPPLPILEFLTQAVGSDRPANEVGRVFGYFGMEVQNFYQIQGFNGYDPLYIERYGELLMAAGDGKIKSPSTRGVGLERRGEYTMPLLNLLGGKYVLHALGDDRHVWTFNFWDYPGQFKKIYQDEKYEVYENLQAFPRAFMAYDYQVVTEPQTIIDTMFDSRTDLRKTLILEEKPELEEIEEKGSGQVEIVNYSLNQIELKIQTESPGLLFLSDNHYPGWQALVDGKETDIYRADYSFRAVPISKGDHKVEFIYKPLSFKWGLLISFSSLAAVLIFSFLFRRQKE